MPGWGKVKESQTFRYPSAPWSKNVKVKERQKFSPKFAYLFLCATCTKIKPIFLTDKNTKTLVFLDVIH